MPRLLVRLWDGLIIALIPVLVAYPWLFGMTERFNADPGQWLEHIGLVIAVIGWVGASKLHKFLSSRMSDTTPINLPFLVVMLFSAVVGTPLAFFGDWVYAQARFRTQEAALVRYVDGDGACPGIRCFRDEKGVVAIVWGESMSRRSWTGVCHDPQRIMPPLGAAGIADFRAGRPARATLFGGEPRRAQPLTGDWLMCSVVYRDLPDPRDA